MTQTNLLNTHSLSMSSIEISELTGKRHNNVTADIRNLLDALQLRAADFSATQVYGNNNTREVFTLDKDLTMTLVSGYDAKLRFNIVKRWRELEEAANPSFELLTPEQLMQRAYDLKSQEADEKSADTCTPTQLASLVKKLGNFKNVTAEAMNVTLCKMGFQERTRTATGVSYQLTQKGKQYGVIASGNARNTFIHWRAATAKVIYAWRQQQKTPIGSQKMRTSKGVRSAFIK
ncbi:Rha family transcriptional regulator [Vibrio alginolyticus]|uniref:Rha family transcriptional regulator n=1 Tax=Vibrio alginolyticus TaxID=663 RepID=UPI0037549B37